MSNVARSVMRRRRSGRPRSSSRGLDEDRTLARYGAAGAGHLAPAVMLAVQSTAGNAAATTMTRPVAKAASGAGPVVQRDREEETQRILQSVMARQGEFSEKEKALFKQLTGKDPEPPKPVATPQADPETQRIIASVLAKQGQFSDKEKALFKQLTGQEAGTVPVPKPTDVGATPPVKDLDLHIHKNIANTVKALKLLTEKGAAKHLVERRGLGGLFGRLTKQDVVRQATDEDKARFRATVQQHAGEARGTTAEDSLATMMSYLQLQRSRSANSELTALLEALRPFAQSGCYSPREVMDKSRNEARRRLGLAPLEKAKPVEKPKKADPMDRVAAMLELLVATQVGAGALGPGTAGAGGAKDTTGTPAPTGTTAPTGSNGGKDARSPEEQAEIAKVLDKLTDEELHQAWLVRKLKRIKGD